MDTLPYGTTGALALGGWGCSLHSPHCHFTPLHRSPLPTEICRLQRCFIYSVLPWLRRQHPHACCFPLPGRTRDRPCPLRGCPLPGVSDPARAAFWGSPTLCGRLQEAQPSLRSPAAQRAAYSPSASPEHTPKGKVRGWGFKNTDPCGQGTAASPCPGHRGGSSVL